MTSDILFRCTHLALKIKTIATDMTLAFYIWPKCSSSSGKKKESCQQVGHVDPMKGIIIHCIPLRPTCCRPPFISQGLNGVTGTVVVCGDPEQSTGCWLHESFRENTLSTAEEPLCLAGLFFHSRD